MLKTLGGLKRNKIFISGIHLLCNTLPGADRPGQPVPQCGKVQFHIFVIEGIT